MVAPCPCTAVTCWTREEGDQAGVVRPTAGDDLRAVVRAVRTVRCRSGPVRENFFGSYDTDMIAARPLDPDRFAETTSMQGSTDEGWFTWSQGCVGRDVTGVTVHTPSGLDIEASVAGNRFAAWWPSNEPSSGHPDATWSYTGHLADGSTRRTS